MRSWLNPKVESAEELAEKTKEICGIYESAKELAEQGIKVYSTDECTGIQAKERLNADKPLKKGKVRRVEYEYIRHGTVCLTANFEVASGQVESPTINETRTETDFAGHIKKTVEETPEVSEWWFIVDQLNTHKSESLVKLVAEKEGVAEAELGEKGKSGILLSMKTRQEFLEKDGHQIRFIYTPKHWSVAQSGGDMVFDIVKEANKMGKFQVKRRFTRAIRKIHRVF